MSSYGMGDAEKVRMARAKAKQPRMLAMAEDKPVMGLGPSAVRPEVGAGGGPLQFGVEARTSTPAPVTPRPVTRPNVPATRTVSGVSSTGIPQDQVGGEIRKVAQDRAIAAQRLGATYRAAQVAKQSGNIDEYNRLMDAWQGQLQDRRDIESYGSNLSQAQPRQFVTPEKAQADAQALPGMVAQARYAAGQRSLQAIQGQEDGSYEAGANAAPGIAAQRFSQPSDQIRQKAMLDFIGQEPTLDSGGNLTTGGAIVNARRRAQQAQILAEMNKPANPAEPVDVAGINARYDQATERAQSAGERAGQQYQARAKAEQFRREYTNGQRELATANQQADIAQAEARKTGQDSQSLLARAEYERARRGYDTVASADDFASAKSSFETAASLLHRAALGDSGSQSDIKSALRSLERVYHKLTPEQKLEIQAGVRDMSQKLDEIRPGFWSSVIELTPIAPFVDAPIGQAQSGRNFVDSTKTQLRNIQIRPAR